MKVKRFYEPLLTADVIFITDSKPPQVAKWMKRNYKKDMTDYSTLAGSVSFLDEVDKEGKQTREYLIIVEGKKEFYTLMHEVIHLVDHIFHDRMIPITQDNSEIRAYYQVYWFKKLWRFMNNIEVTLKRK